MLPSKSGTRARSTLGATGGLQFLRRALLRKSMAHYGRPTQTAAVTWRG
jgi:hypothetical protein